MVKLRRVLLVQLPIPPAGLDPMPGNVPLAAAYLKLFARRKGLERHYQIDLFPVTLANTLGDQALVEAILAAEPNIVGFSCYLWNVERSLWIADQLKRRRPELVILVGGPEVTPDNRLVLENRAVDFAIAGEGETTFGQLLAAFAENVSTPRIAGLWHRGQSTAPGAPAPLGSLDQISSPYVDGILEIGDDRRMLLETARGCRFRCKYCYYPKEHAALEYLSDEQVLANLRYAVEHSADEVVLLDPTLNQRPDFAEFLQLLARGNPDRRLSFSGELRAEGIDARLAKLLREAGFHEVEIGLQSVNPEAWRRMRRPTNLAAFERGVKMLLAEGIKVHTDLIVGLPGDTVDTVRRGIDYLLETRAYSTVQVFNLAILPGTDFRREAEQLGLRYQPWPPYYVLETPTLNIGQMCELIEEAQEAFGIEFDPLPPADIEFLNDSQRSGSVCRIDLDANRDDLLPAELRPTLAFVLWLRSGDFHARRDRAAAIIRQILDANPHTTLQVVLEPSGDPRQLTVEALDVLLRTCYRSTTYLDRYYSLHPGRLLGAKRLFVLLPHGSEVKKLVDEDWLDAVGEYAAVVTG